MMFGIRSNRFGAIFSLSTAVLLFAGSEARCQESIEDLYNKSVQAMNAGDWEQGLKFCDQIIQEFGEFAYEDYGPKFGGIYYNKGFCEMKMQNYSAAVESFPEMSRGVSEQAAGGQGGRPGGDQPLRENGGFSARLVQSARRGI